MSAPAQAYFLIDAKFRGSNDVEQIVNPAKAQADIATLKARFYLDDVIAFKAVWAGVEYHGFWGTVLPSGFNYDHHKTSRMLEINGPKQGQILRTFNDAGLNSSGDATVATVVTNWANYIKLNLVFKSAFYFNSSEFGIEYKRVADSVWIKQVLSTAVLLKNTSQAITYIVQNDYNLSDQILIRPYIINPEKNYQFDLLIDGAKPIIEADAISRVTACASSGTVTSFFMFKEDFENLASTLTDLGSATGIIAYTNDLMTVPIGSGFFAGMFSDPKKVAIVDATGQFTSYIICQPSQASMSVSVIAGLATGGFDVYLSKTGGVAFGTSITIIGKIQAYDGATPVSGDFQSFSVALGSNALDNSVFVPYTTNSAYTYQFLDVISTPATVGGSLVIITDLEVEQ